MLYKKNNQFHFYETVTTFYDSRVPDQPRESFTHTPEQMDYVTSKSTIVNAKSTPFEPTPEQIERLAVINEHYTAENLSHYAAIEFVRKGFIPTNGELDDLPTEYHIEYVSRLKNILSEAIRQHRQKLEISGTSFEYNGVTVPLRTDLDTQSKIASAKIALSDPLIAQGETLDWELQPFVWDSVDLERIQLISSAVFRHIQSCFTQSKLKQEQINACNTIDELFLLDLDWIDVKDIEPFNQMVPYDMDDSSGGI